MILAEAKGGYGLEVSIDHGNGFRTVYAHLSRAATTKGATVKAGDVITFFGQSGLAHAPSLHSEVIRNGTNVDPKEYLPPSAAKWCCAAPRPASSLDGGPMSHSRTSRGILA